MFAAGNSAGATAANYIEDVFSTYLYTGNSSTQTITNNIDLSGKGGLFWAKCRSSSSTFNWLVDTVRGADNILRSNTTDAQVDNGAGSSFLSTGYSIGSTSNSNYNGSGNTYASWTFRKQPKFFDVVTYTGDGVAGRTVSHNLGSTPGCIFVKATSTTGEWSVYHTGVGNTAGIFLNRTVGSTASAQFWNNTSPTSTNFTVGNVFTNSSGDRKSTRLNSSHTDISRMPSSA